MPGLTRIFVIFGAVVLFILGCTHWGGGPVLSHAADVVPQRKIAVPPKKETELAHSQIRGKAIYLYYCATCHGDTGNSDGFNAYSLPEPPPKLSDTKFMALLSDETIKQAIKEGGGGIGLSPYMPIWGGVLTDRDISDVTSYLRTLGKE